MKANFDHLDGPSISLRQPDPVRSFVQAETDRLTEVILCPPHYLAPVPCCAVTRSSLEGGFTSCRSTALEQHAALTGLLRRHGVRCHVLEPSPGMADMCFTRDIGVSTPFGHVVLNPAMPHRRGEVVAHIAALNAARIPFRQIVRGTIEGGDICVAREGLLLVGISGERSSAAGVEEFATPFRDAGWQVIICPFHFDHLHLDTIFCMVGEQEAIGCIDLLDPAFVNAVRSCGITILPAPATEAGRLGCNILSLGARRVIASSEIVATILRASRYLVDLVNISQFAACGGGVHCLTQPLQRLPGRSSGR
ncbi:dimethylarginine dimethylaminohydrolase family protein [Sphingomonas sp. R1]|uniref:dimethylarginine dimethylaminohydrolase family protein n=1 Tax=Sphingomonas sp. R1 TaxID=399176 RepID=UPI00222525B7|nr:arginine deiminase family protein [Sphingomonas sp. R1]UYY76895.1 arginine deiminase family protein [Sphingomonas sp. R1]